VDADAAALDEVHRVARASGAEQSLPGRGAARVQKLAQGGGPLVVERGEERHRAQGFERHS
jgi:hypothetical protein